MYTRRNSVEPRSALLSVIYASSSPPSFLAPSPCGHLFDTARPALISISLYCRPGDAGQRWWISCTGRIRFNAPRVRDLTRTFQLRGQDRQRGAREKDSETERDGRASPPVEESKTNLIAARGAGQGLLIEKFIGTE